MNASMNSFQVIEVPKLALTVLNNLCEIERKLAMHGDAGNASRNLQRIKEVFASDMNLFYEDPQGQRFAETRTDLEASITGASADDLVVVEVIKPVIRIGNKEFSRVIQKGVVIVQSLSLKGIS